MKSPRQITFAKLVEKYGPVRHAQQITDAEWMAARERGCFATVYHGECDWIAPIKALVRHDGFCNTLCKIAWEKPLPQSVKTIIGMRNNDDAIELCNQ